jgi:linoleoyl-CoA desaturase
MRAPKYPRHGALRAELNRRVDSYFDDRRLGRTGGARFISKALIMVAWFCLSYVALMWWAQAWWAVGLLAISMGLAHAGIGFSVMHDGGHGAASSSRWVSKLAALSLDCIGGSSTLWAFKHNVVHHQYPNVDGVDHDIVVQPWLRLTDTQVRHRFHRAQHLYFPLAYTFLTAKWLLHDDFRTLLRRRLGDIPTPRLSRWAVAQILLFKVFTVFWALVLPVYLHGFWWGIGVFVTWAAVSGLALATVFQLAHSVESTEGTATPPAGERLPRTWAEQQLASTTNFAPDNWLLSWYVGGLNFQVEHHLFPRVSHVHYKALAPIVRQVCDEHGVEYRSQKTFRAAIGNHARYLRALGAAPAPLVAPAVAGAELG